MLCTLSTTQAGKACEWSTLCALWAGVAGIDLQIPLQFLSHAQEPGSTIIYFFFLYLGIGKGLFNQKQKNVILKKNIDLLDYIQVKL